MNLGLIVAYGNRETIFGAPKEDGTRTLLQAELPIPAAGGITDHAVPAQ